MKRVIICHSFGVEVHTAGFFIFVKIDKTKSAVIFMNDTTYLTKKITVQCLQKCNGKQEAEKCSNGNKK